MERVSAVSIDLQVALANQVMTIGQARLVVAGGGVRPPSASASSHHPGRAAGLCKVAAADTDSVSPGS